MNNQDFQQKLDDGKRATEVFASNMKLLTGLDIITVRDITRWKVEGCDYIINTLQWEKTEYDDHIANELSEAGMKFRPRLVHGSAEVKGISMGRFLHRNDVSVISVPFALWNGVNRYGSKATRAKHGSLKRLFNPDILTLSAEPLVLSYVVEDKDIQLHERPFATITFTDFPELKRRLIKLASDNGMNLLDWKTIPTGKKAWEYERGDLVFTGNMWMVPLDLLVDIARIIIIGDPPRFFKNGSCTIEMQEERYQYMIDHATLVLPQDAIKTDGDVPTLLQAHPIMQLLINGAPKFLKGKLVDINGNLF